MANCSQCGKDVGCGCNLVGGFCMTCYSKSLSDEGLVTQKQKKSSGRIIYYNSDNNQPNTEFETILKTSGLSKEEKIKRINDILEKARQIL